MFGPGGLDQRIQAVIHGAAGALPASARKHAAAQPNATALERLTGLMKVWGRDARMDQANFAEHFLGRSADDSVAARLRNAAMTANLAQSHAELREAAGDLAAAQQMVGLDRWYGFVADAAQRASDPATTAAIEKIEQMPGSRKDANTLSHPLASTSTRRDAGSYQVAQLVVPGVGLPPPPPFSGKPVDDPTVASAKYLTRGLRAVTEAVGDAIGHIVNSEAGDTRDKPPAGSKPIDKTPWSGDHDRIKGGIGAKPADNVSVSPAGDVWGQNPDGTWTNHGPAGTFTGSGKPIGRRGKDRDR